MNKEPRDINSPAMKKEFLAWLEARIEKYGYTTENAPDYYLKAYKSGDPHDLERRELEQNVLPVAAKILATAKVASMDHARSIEQSIHKVIEDFKINNANNRELFRLKPDDLASLIEIFKKIDIRN